ncbi:hypothetical protein [Halobacillus campisalis]|uniref:RiboL-PSP-HEPN domain-containing protein n=1 Tax=Halobacillus campisalis TaxID=435909 RepID=A0ABW2K1J1_9BACI|nr:hypothetical protein [Halobacillus campisalis]
MNTVKRTYFSPEYPPYNSSLKNIILLNDTGTIDLDTLNSLKELRELRNNKVVHGQIPDENITYSEAIKYYDLSKKVTRVLKNITREHNRIR